MAIVLDLQRVPIFPHPNLLYLGHSKQLLQDKGRELLAEICKRGRSTGEWLWISCIPPREQDLSYGCSFPIFNSLSLHSLLPYMSKNRKGALVFKGMWQRRDPNKKSFSPLGRWGPREGQDDRLLALYSFQCSSLWCIKLYVPGV